MKRDWPSRFAENIRNYQGYPIGKTIQYLTDPEIISLAGGLPSPDVFQRTELRMATERAFDRDIDRIMQYSPIPGEARLVQAVLRFLERDDIRISDENILITTSGQHGLDLLGRLFLEPGDVVLVDRPTFAGALVAFEMQRPRFVGVNIEDDGSDVAGMRRRLDELAADGISPKFIYVVPDFQNPAGITMSEERRTKLIELAHTYDVLIIEDSPYKELRFEGETQKSIFALDGTGHVIGLHTFSKILFPGMRLGWMIGDEAVIQKMVIAKQSTDLCTPPFNQAIIAEFAARGLLGKVIEKVKSIYRVKRDLMLEALDEHMPDLPGLSWTRPEGGLFLWVRLPDGFDAEQLFYEALEQNVAFVVGTAFHCDGGGQNAMRLNFSFPTKENIAEGVKRLASVIAKHKTAAENGGNTVISP